MQRNTTTTIGTLREGDRFYFSSDKKKEVHEVVKHLQSKTMYNKMKGEEHAWTYARDSGKFKTVMFLRHTIIYPGEQCFLQDLPEGSTVTAQERTFIISQHFGNEVKLKEGIKIVFTSPLTTVTLVSLPAQGEA